ncbi:hypothetical protein GCK72_025266 [Caenorhabditis remanei]|uniref:Uncharacterized protein n=1 Tax=Caenorhabditis remanei TaxID=31234 RepID=A0A6A5G2M7_CAERE|nr:hypothetical protein GCK72_025266 [Caenorhabditis remanei]KAF1748799.1 hypothetical protein GCK72_025266 [Caenorhabditis remanei]
MEEEENRCLFIKVTGNDIQLAKWQMLANVFAQRLETPNTSFTITPIDNRFAGSGLSANSLRIALAQLEPNVRDVFQVFGPSYSTIVNSQYINVLQTPMALRARSPLIFQCEKYKCNAQKKQIAHTHHYRNSDSILIVPGVNMDLSESHCVQSLQNQITRFTHEHPAFQQSIPALINVFAQTLGGLHPGMAVAIGNLPHNNARLIMTPNQIQAGLPVQPELPVEPQEANDNQQTGLPMEEKRCLYIKIIGNDHQLINWQMYSHALTVALSQLEPDVRAVFQSVGPSYSTIVNSQYINLLQTPMALRARRPLYYRCARYNCERQKQQIAHTHHLRTRYYDSILIVPGVNMDISESHCTQSFQNGLIRFQLEHPAFQQSIPALINVLAQNLGGLHPLGIALGNLLPNNAGLIMMPNQILAGQPMQPEIPVEPEEANLGHEEAEQPDEAEIVNMEE